MKFIIITAEKDKENQELLAKKMDKTTMVEVIKILAAIDIGKKFRQTIINTNIDAIEDLELISIKKYQKYTTQI